MLAIVAIDAVYPSAGEGDTTPAFIDFSRRDCDWSQPLTVSFSWAGTAESGADYHSNAGQFTFAPYQVSTRIAVVPVDDDLSEEDETITATLATSNEYSIDQYHASASINLFDNDINQAPSFNVGSNVARNEDVGDQTIANWATNISPGSPSEADQQLTFIVTANTNPGLFDSQPTISADGMLAFRPAANASGSATIRMVLMDDGGTAHGGHDTSIEQSFDITIEPVNDAPSFTLNPPSPNQSVAVDEDAGPVSIAGFATNISPGPTDEAQQSLAWDIANDNTGLFAEQPWIDGNGTLHFQSAPNAHGSANATAVLHDNGGTVNNGKDQSSPQTFSIVVNSVTDPPPAVSLSGPTADVFENSNAVFTATISVYAPVTYVTSGGDMGTITVPGTYTLSFNPFIVDDGPSPGNGTPSDAYSFDIFVSDGIHAPATASAQANVVNLNPTVILDSMHLEVTEGDSFTVSGSVTDASPADNLSVFFVWRGQTYGRSGLHSGDTFSLTVDAGDDDASGAPSDTYDLTVNVLDDDTGSSSATGTLTINNVAPTLHVSGSASGAYDEGSGSSFTISGTADDPVDNITVSLYENDVLVSSMVVSPGGSFSFTIGPFADDDPSGTPSDTMNYKVVAEDDDAGSDETSAGSVTINNVDPTITGGGDLGEFEECQGPPAIPDPDTITDPGTDTFTIHKDPSPAPGTIGSHTITVWAEDDDTGISNTITFTYTIVPCDCGYHTDESEVDEPDEDVNHSVDIQVTAEDDEYDLDDNGLPPSDANVLDNDEATATHHWTHRDYYHVHYVKVSDCTGEILDEWDGPQQYRDTDESEDVSDQVQWDADPGSSPSHAKSEPAWDVHDAGAFAYEGEPDELDLYRSDSFTYTAIAKVTYDGQEYSGQGDANVDLRGTELTSITVVNMNAEVFDEDELMQGISLPADFSPDTAQFRPTAGSERGGVVTADGNRWKFTPNHTYDPTSPWNPGNPNDPNDNTWKTGTQDGNGNFGNDGAMFTGTLTDDNGKQVRIVVQVKADHRGYEYAIKGSSLDSGHQGSGGLFSHGGQTGADDGYAWFASRANGGDFVIIGNDNDGNQEIADEFYNFGANSVEVFDFDVEGSEPSNDAIGVGQDDGSQDSSGEGLGRELLDRLHYADLVYFRGGDQWIYMQVFRNSEAARLIGENAGNGILVVGGTSAGTAIQGSFVFNAAHIRGANDVLLSEDIVSNYNTPAFAQNGATSIEGGLFGNSQLSGVIMDTHFTDSGASYEPTGGIHYTVNDVEVSTYRLGRWLSFMGSIMIDQALSVVRGIGVDDHTALAILPNGDARVFGEKHVYFATTTNEGDIFLTGSGNPGDPVWLTTPYIMLRWYDANSGWFPLYNGWNQSAGQFARFRINQGTLQFDDSIDVLIPFAY